MIELIETAAQRDADRVREHAPKLLSVVREIRGLVDYGDVGPFTVQRISGLCDEAIEYATGAHDPDVYPEQGYEVDAAGTFTG